MLPNVTLCIPTLNPGKYSEKLVDAILSQTLMPNRILVVDSSSSDNSLDVFSRINAAVRVINRADFDHGATRNIAFLDQSSDIFIFLTQDAIPVNKTAFEKLITCFYEFPRCGVAYGRQVAESTHSLFAQHARLFNYPSGFNAVEKSEVDIPVLGIKTAFCSNSFSAYRLSAMKEINFFPEGTLFGEDALAAALLLKHNWSVVYQPEAMVCHAHSYTLLQEFTRYFDVGAFHASNPWFLNYLGKADGEGIRFVKSEFNFLKKSQIRWAFFLVFFRNLIRWNGYKLGRLSTYLPNYVCSLLSQNKNYWIKD